MDLELDHNYYKPAKRSNNYCSVPQCGNRAAKGISFHIFPRDEVLKAEWSRQLRLGKEVSKCMVVCSAHFAKDAFFYFGELSLRKRLKKNAVPTLKVPGLNDRQLSYRPRCRPMYRVVEKRAELEVVERLGSADADADAHAVEHVEIKVEPVWYEDGEPETLWPTVADIEVPIDLGLGALGDLDPLTLPSLAAAPCEVVAREPRTSVAVRPEPPGTRYCTSLHAVLPGAPDSPSECSTGTGSPVLEHESVTCDEDNLDERSLDGSGLEGTRSEEKCFECSACGVAFSRAGSLTEHEKLHSREKPHACDSCDGRFASKKALGSHRKMHSGAKRFGCDECKAEFDHRYSLDVHKTLHYGARGETTRAKQASLGSMTSRRTEGYTLG